MNGLSPILMLSATVASAGGHGHGELDWWVLGSIITNAVLFFGFIAIKVKPLVKNGLITRRENMAQALAEAKQKQKDAEAKLKEYKYKLEHLEEEVNRVVESYKKEAEADRERFEDETAKALERLERENEFTIRQEMRKAERLIHEAAVRATLEAAEELVSSRITDADRRRLSDQYITNLEQLN